jgi:hypothetical protein
MYLSDKMTSLSFITTKAQSDGFSEGCLSQSTIDSHGLVNSLTTCLYGAMSRSPNTFGRTRFPKATQPWFMNQTLL